MLSFELIQTHQTGNLSDLQCGRLEEFPISEQRLQIGVREVEVRAVRRAAFSPARHDKFAAAGGFAARRCAAGAEFRRRAAAY